MKADEGRPPEHSHNPIVRYFRILGPGLVTGASDDDPSGIATYSIAGAVHGYRSVAVTIVAIFVLGVVLLAGFRAVDSRRRA